MIVLRTPKGWTGPKEVDGLPVEGTWRAHQVPLAEVREKPDHLAALESWMRSYRPEELFDEAGAPCAWVVDWLPRAGRRMGANPHANGGLLLRDLTLPAFRDYGVAVTSPGEPLAEATRVLGQYLRDVFRLNADARDFRLFGPDETASNRLDAVYEATPKAWQAEILPVDVALARDGRVMEILSETTCQGWLEGYLLTGRHGLFSCYEAFTHIVDSMFNQHAKWLKVTRTLPWRRPIASLNYLLTSHVWRQDNNGFTHQDPGFIDLVVNKKAEVVRVYLPPDTNTLLSTVDHCLRTRNYVNVIVAGKQPQPTWLSIDDADLHCTRGVGIFDWASNDDGGEPDVVMACAGDVPTLETLAAVSLLRTHLPELKVRVVNVVDLMRLEPDTEHPHGLSDRDYDALFTVDKPVIFAYHGYPSLIHRLTYRRHGHDNLHVRGYKEEGTVTTPFDMVVLNDMDRFHLVMDVIDRVPGLGAKAALVRQHMVDARTRHVEYTHEFGEDMPEVRDLDVVGLMRVLVVNAGSSSLKLTLLGDDDAVEAEHGVERWNADDGAPQMSGLLEAMPPFDAVGHRVVHGGRKFRDAVRVDAGIEHALLALSSLAPLHQPRAVAGIGVLRRLYPDTPQVACFDTAFHATLSDAASTYALPREWRDRWGLQRFGFHGLSHAYATRRAAELVDRAGDPDLRIVSCHLGAGASLCATQGGRSVDTTMGFTPLEGLVMATRAGTVDPGLVVWLIQQGELGPDELARALESDSGLAGLSGIVGGDMRDVVAACATGDERAVLAFDVYTHRLRRELGGMIAVLGGLDALVFTGGVGEHAHEVRAAACEQLGFAGVSLDSNRNLAIAGEGAIGAADATVPVFVVPAREDVEITRQVRALLVPRGMTTSDVTDLDVPAALARRFEAVMFDWDGTAVVDRGADASAVRRVVEQLCASGVDVAVVSGTHLENVDNQLAARPAGPGRLWMALNRGSELFEVGVAGPQLVSRREATPDEDAALTRAAERTVAELAARGLETRVVSQRLNRRKIDLIPLAAWADPPKSEIDRLLAAVEARLEAVGIADLAEVAALATTVARDAGLADPRVTSDAKHVEIGLTDKTDSAHDVFAQLWADGIAPESVLIGGDEFGALGGLPGSDSLMCVAEAARSSVFSVGIEPNGVPAGVLHLPGGPPRFLEVLREQVGRRADVPHLPVHEGWALVVDGFDPERSYEALLTLADGLIGTNGAPLFTHPGARPDVLAAGVFDGAGPLTDLLAGPHWAALRGTLAPEDRIVRVLDLRGGVLVEDVSGTTRLRSVRFSSLARPGTAVLRADVDPPETSAALVAPDGSQPVDLGDGTAWAASRGADGSITAAAAQVRDANRLDRIAAYVVGSGTGEPDRAAAALASTRADGFDVLFAEHRRAWAQRWERADIRIEGDEQLQLGVRASLFHLMASVAVEGEAAVGARGMTGHDYHGHVFWDADLFVLPFLVATEPAAARAMLEYRYNRLPAALAAARAEGRRGARFPWESAALGVDVTPRSARDANDRVVPIRTGEAEVHIVGDVAWAACCYIDWTGDREFADGPGRRILIETARYWASRIRVDATGAAHLYGVIGPDEYHEPVDDNAFTNVLARWNLRRAAEIQIGSMSSGGNDVETEEPATWRRLADALVDGFSPSTRVYEEFAGFYDLEPAIVRDLAPRRPIDADVALGADLVHRSQIVKQTDVLMIHHLLPDEAEPGSLAANLEFYEPRTAHGSSLSLGIHAALLARAGRVDEAVAALRTTAGLDENDAPQTGAGGVHLGAMGSVWHALAYGFAGLRPSGDALVVDPRVPDAWSGFELGVQFRGVRLRIRLEHGSIIVRASAPVVVIADGTRVACPAGETRLPGPAQ